ncbi:uncharacterized protein LOC107043223 [Diachasma alloeum]|uniref:uncharacterized protein LOC107043223 n=1 Tax=Diachasma alloeum TaxID=454923 RepID=UPI0007384D6B|nr:uncharacterized protein LOC107043223 [Diachasma alloeum]
MKWVIIALSLITTSGASLEPTGYKPPVTSAASDQYLPPSYRGASPRGVLTPESHYLPPNHQSLPQNVIPNSLYLPSARPPSSLHNSVSPSSLSLLSERYLPSHHSSPPIATPSHHHASDTVQDSRIGHHVSPNPPPSRVTQHTANRNIVSSQYLPPSQRDETFTQAIPSSTYLPANQNQYAEIQPSTSIVPPNTYLTPNKFSTASPGGFSGSHLDRGDSHLNSGRLSQPAGHYYPDSGYDISGSNGGYMYEQPPAKYQFEYRVNDEYGNDYSHKESREGDNTQGVYTVLLPDGRKQIVHYKADRNGYMPTITYEDAAPGKSGYNQGY